MRLLTDFALFVLVNSLYRSNLVTAKDEVDDAEQRTIAAQEKWGWDLAYSGISTFAHLPHVKCLTHPDEKYDVAIIGAPFDTAITYRTGARFGPEALRHASARQTPNRAHNTRAGLNPYASWAKIIDCGDIPITPFDNGLALRQMTEAFTELGLHETNRSDVFEKPRLVALGGDHSLALPALRALHKIHGQKIHVLHFDAHLDTWAPLTAYSTTWLDESKPIEEQQSSFTHGSMFWLAAKEELIAEPSVHAGLRCRLTSEQDNLDDTTQGWVRIASDAISPDLLGPLGVAERIMRTLGTDVPVYLSIDIDVLDPGLAPGTGTPESGGWLPRELIRVIRSLDKLNIVGADLVEVAPSYDGSGEPTALAGAQLVYEVITSIVGREARKLDTSPKKSGGKWHHKDANKEKDEDKDEL